MKDICVTSKKTTIKKEKLSWKELYYFLKGACAGGEIYYYRCNTAFVTTAKLEGWFKYMITLCGNINVYKNYRNLVIDLGHELGHIYKINIKHPNSIVFKQICSPTKTYYSEEEATQFLIDVIDYFEMKLTPYERKKIQKLMKNSIKYDKKYKVE